jgi:hypothetical protein
VGFGPLEFQAGPVSGDKSMAIIVPACVYRNLCAVWPGLRVFSRSFDVHLHERGLWVFRDDLPRSVWEFATWVCADPRVPPL